MLDDVIYVVSTRWRNSSTPLWSPLWPPLWTPPAIFALWFLSRDLFHCFHFSSFLVIFTRHSHRTTWLWHITTFIYIIIRSISWLFDKKRFVIRSSVSKWSKKVVSRGFRRVFLFGILRMDVDKIILLALVAVCMRFGVSKFFAWFDSRNQPASSTSTQHREWLALSYQSNPRSFHPPDFNLASHFTDQFIFIIQYASSRSWSFDRCRCA